MMAPSMGRVAEAVQEDVHTLVGRCDRNSVEIPTA